MKYIGTTRLAGLCLAAVFAVSLVASATASASIQWEQCRTEKTGEPPTKWKNSLCSEKEAAGKWEWQELNTTEKVRSSAVLKLTNTNVPTVGKVTVECERTDTGTIGPKQYDRIETIQVSHCAAGENCGTFITARAVHLPWQTALYVSGKEQRDAITEVSGSGGAPGWYVECVVLSVPTGYECTTNEGSVYVTNKANGTVQAIFEKNSGKASCTVGGEESGEVTGSDYIWSEGGWAIKVS